MYVKNSDYPLLSTSRYNVGHGLTHKYGKKVALLPCHRRTTFLRTRTLTLTQRRVEREQEALLATLWTTFHPLALCHKLYPFTDLSDVNNFRFLFYFDYFFTAIL